jgi:hypothetical protein
MNDQTERSAERLRPCTTDAERPLLEWCTGSLEVAPGSPEPTPTPLRYRIARVLNAAFGAWLFASAFLWEHSSAQLSNVIMVGFLVSVFALMALVMPVARYVNALLALWLLSSIFVLPSLHDATLYNSALLGLAIFALAVLGRAQLKPARGEPSASATRRREYMPCRD